MVFNFPLQGIIPSSRNHLDILKIIHNDYLSVNFVLGKSFLYVDN